MNNYSIWEVEVWRMAIPSQPADLTGPADELVTISLADRETSE